MPTEIQWRRITGVCIQRECTERATQLVVAVDWDERTVQALLVCDGHAKALEAHLRTQGGRDVALA